MQHKKLTSVLIFLALVFAFLSWRSIDQAITVAGSSIWLVPTIWISLFFITICLAFVLFKERYIAELLVVACYLLSFIFIFDLTRIIALILATLLVSLGLIRIKKDLDLNIKIDIGKSIYAGKVFIVTSLAIMISSQYYSTIKYTDTTALIPKFNFGEGSGAITSSILSMANPQFRSVQDSSSTVDEFLIETQNNQMEQNSSLSTDSEVDQIIEEQGGNNITPAQRAAIKADALDKINQSKDKVFEASQALALEEGRAKLSELAGKTVTGNEKIADIFSEIVNNKIAGYFQPVEADSTTAAFLPMIFALVLFLTVIPLANFLWLFFPSLIGGIFKILVRFEVVRVGLVMTEVEKIE